jgi:hypothetical protein
LRAPGDLTKSTKQRANGDGADRAAIAQSQRNQMLHHSPPKRNPKMAIVGQRRGRQRCRM